jgi:crossover junction endodeoxyribonuclease RuvC
LRDCSFAAIVIFEMKILGVDPGIGRAGWGIIAKENSKWYMVHCGCIETSKDLPLEKRLLILYDELVAIIKENVPDAVAIEDLFFSTNAKTAIAVGQARGVIVLAAIKAGLSVAAYAPLEMKLAVTGFGKAEKKQVEKMTMLLLDMKEKPERDDATDALAIALTHAFSYRLQSKQKK